ILSDAPPEETAPLRGGLRAAGVHSVLLVAPTSPARRISLIAAEASGYIYYVSLRGVTGPRERLPDDLVAGLGRVRAVASQPIAVGFGISTPAQAAEAAAHADAVIVGSALVATLERSLGTPDTVAQIGRFVRDLRSAIG
ncbi:MAG TPA: tryptophan synthase subunit alpha, partial [Candidatus Sulfotelmatobacter sp.]|nr:tryptophan synthase subunit alpha [Candidatus Sulfotelmatobacter sp.]